MDKTTKNRKTWKQKHGNTQHGSCQSTKQMIKIAKMENENDKKWFGETKSVQNCNLNVECRWTVREVRDVRSSLISDTRSFGIGYTHEKLLSIMENRWGLSQMERAMLALAIRLNDNPLRQTDFIAIALLSQYDWYLDHLLLHARPSHSSHPLNVVYNQKCRFDVHLARTRHK